MECFDIEPFMHWSVLKKCECVLVCYACPLNEIALVVDILPHLSYTVKATMATEGISYGDD